jgi:hypothetical protein
MVILKEAMLFLFAPSAVIKFLGSKMRLSSMML